MVSAEKLLVIVGIIFLIKFSSETGLELIVQGPFCCLVNDRDVLRVNSTESCTAKLPPLFNERVNAINRPNGGCVNLYKEENCEGQSLEIPDGTEEEQYLSDWRGFSEKVRSVGPCLPPCHPDRLKALPESQSTTVTIYTRNEFRGQMMELEVNRCTPIPTKLRKRIYSIKPIEGEACMELHEFWNCTGKVLRLQKDYTRFGYITYISPPYFGAVSLCNYNCTLGPSHLPAAQNQVTLYDMTDFQGYSKDFTLNLRNGCVDLSEEWEGETRSIQTFGKCLTIFDLNDCDRSSKYLDLNGLNTEIQKSLGLGGFDRLIRSMKLCDKAMQSGESSCSRIHILAIFLATIISCIL